MTEREMLSEEAPHPLRAIRLAADEAFHAERWREAADLYWRLLLSDEASGTPYSKSRDLWFRFGTTCSHLDMLGHAVDAFERIIKAHPDDLPALEGAAWSHFTQTMKPALYSLVQRKLARRRSAELFRKVVSKNPTDVGAWEALGIMLGPMGDLQGAARAFRECIRLDPARTGSWSGLGDTYVKQANAEGAASVYRHLYECGDEGNGRMFAEKLREYAREHGIILADA